MTPKSLAVAAMVGLAAFLPTGAQAATGGFYWSPDGSGIQSASLHNPQSGRCYALRGSQSPFYAINNTNRTVHYYRSANCSGHSGSITPGMSGNVTRYVKFD